MRNVLILSFMLISACKNSVIGSNTNPSLESLPIENLSFQLINTTNSVSFNSTPKLEISNVNLNDQVSVHSDSDCKDELGLAISSSEEVQIQTTPLTDGIYNFYVKVVRNDQVGCASSGITYEVKSCPSGYIGVPGDVRYNTSDFCVMKYEAKNAGPFESPSLLSIEGFPPFIPRTRPLAKVNCTDIGAEYDLIANDEWMTIAVNIEAQSENWSGAAVGSGCLFRGNAGSTDECSYAKKNSRNFNTVDFGPDRNSKAKHILSNKNEIWDFSGNLLEWVDWTVGGPLVDPPVDCSGPEMVQLMNFNCASYPASTYKPLNPGEVDEGFYNAGLAGLGSIIMGNGGALARGGFYNMRTITGVFQFRVDLPNQVIDNDAGLRCVYRY